MTDITGPLNITIPDATGDVVVFKRSDGTIKGKIVVDSLGRLAIAGPNITSNAITIDSLDRVAIGPAPDPIPVRLYVDNDMWNTGTHRIGLPEAFGTTPMDPRGCLQLGRTSATGSNQTMSMVRFFRKNCITGLAEECGREGVDVNGWYSIMLGANDTPVFKVRADNTSYPRYYFLAGFVNGQPAYSEWTGDTGTLKGQHPVSGKVTTIVPA